MRRLLPIVLLTACGPGPSAPYGPPPREVLIPDGQLRTRPRDAEMTRFYGAPEEADGGPQGPPRALILDIVTPTTAARGTVAMMGVRAEDLDAGWVRGRTRPTFFWLSQEIDLSPRITLEAPLRPGLSYLAIINQGSDPLPGPGDLVGGPVPLPEGSPASDALRVAVDRPFEEATARPDDALREGGIPGVPLWPLVLNGGGGAGARVVLLGRRAGVQDAGQGLWSWISPPLPGPLPQRINAPLPDDGSELLGFLDEDGDGAPGAEEPTLRTLRELRRPGTDGELPLRFEAGSTAAQRAELVELLMAAADEGRRRAEGRPVERTLVLSARRPSPTAEGVVIVTTWEPYAPGPPSGTWTSRPRALRWPLELRAPLIPGKDVQVAVDLDGDGRLGPGDLATPRLHRLSLPPPSRSVELGLLGQ